MSCNSEPGSMLFALALQFVSVYCIYLFIQFINAVSGHKLQRRHIRNTFTQVR